ncbi:MAG TPA: oxidoreductase [Edaphobacter sp.]|nr:oxidoreductase [Edaphobacter sp.]
MAMDDEKQPILVGLIGYGYAGKTFHAPLIRSVPGLVLTHVGSTKPDAVHADLPGSKVGNAEDISTHPEVDLVVIASPNESHFPLAAAALRAGKHVVIDKPFTVTLEEARALRGIAQQHGRLLSVFHNRRWDSEILATKAILDSGLLGEVSHYECHMDRFRPVVRQRWREDPGPGAGLWFDLGPHMIDQALYLFGLPATVSAEFGILRRGGKTDDWAHVQLIYKRDGADRLRVILHSSLLVSGGGPRSTLHGTRASWVKFGADVQESQLVSGMLPDDAAFGIDPQPGIVISGETGSRTEIAAPKGDQRMYYVDIRDAIKNQQPPLITVKDAVAVMAILETSFKSGAEGRVLPLPLTQEEHAEWN